MLTAAETWGRHRLSVSHGRSTIARRRSSQVLRSEAKASWRRSTTLIGRCDLINDVLSLVVS